MKMKFTGSAKMLGVTQIKFQKFSIVFKDKCSAWWYLICLTENLAAAEMRTYMCFI